MPMGVNFDRIGAIMKSARAIQTDSAKHRVCACIINRNYHTFFVLSSLRIRVNQTFSHFFFDHTGRSEQRKRCSKVNKKKRRFAGSLNRCAIQYEVSVRASHLPKHSRFVLATAGETFLLLTALVRAQRAKLLVGNRPAALPEKDSLL